MIAAFVGVLAAALLGAGAARFSLRRCESCGFLHWRFWGRVTSPATFTTTNTHQETP